MLTRFSVDPDAVLAASDCEHKRLVREWLQYGVLYYNGTSFAGSEIGAIIEKLPQSARILWKKIVKKAWTKPVSQAWAGWCGLEDCPGAASVLNGEFDLACIEETRLELIREEIGLRCPELEVGVLKEIDTTHCFERSHVLAEKRTDGVRTADLWKERFSVLSAIARNVTIVDRYALADGEGVNGLESFLIQLDGAGKKTNVTIYSAYGDEKLKLTEKEAQDRVVALRGRLARGGVGDIKLFLTDSRRFGYVEHDRFIKFDHLVIEIGSGMAVFNGPKVKKSTFSSKLEQDGHRETLCALQKLCSVAYPVLV